MSDAQATLAEQSRNGDRQAFEELVRTTARAVFARFYLETGDAHRAEDLVQETYLAAWKSIGSLSDPKAFGGWLSSIAHSVLIDSARRDSRKKRGSAFSYSDTLGRISGSGIAPPDDAQSREQKDRMLAVLRSMPAEYRQPLMLRYLAGADYQTISRELSITNGSLRGLLGRGLAMLRERLREK